MPQDIISSSRDDDKNKQMTYYILTMAKSDRRLEPTHLPKVVKGAC